MTEIRKDGPPQLFCGGCRQLLPARELKLDRKTDTYKCQDCRMLSAIKQVLK